MKNMKTMVMKEDEWEKQQSWQNQEYVQSAMSTIFKIRYNLIMFVGTHKKKKKKIEKTVGSKRSRVGTNRR